jgi:ATP-binding cassette subfamily B protein
LHTGLDQKPISFENNIRLDGISHQYADRSSWVIADVNLEIIKGSKVGVIGSTGSGKSTLLDILMGLLEPTKGSLRIDDQLVNISNCESWQSHLAHVPQSIFLADVSVAENIALGLPMEKIDLGLVKEVASKAHISEVIESWPNQYMTKVGERGVQLSGGQRQRIGIARALYKQADVIIFDEATSALDSETELAVMNSIESSNKKITFIMVAHRLNTLKNCDWIIRLEGGGIKEVLTYDQLIQSN